MSALDAIGLFVLKLFRRASKPVPAAPADPLAELRAALERQIETDERSRRRWGGDGTV